MNTLYDKKYIYFEYDEYLLHKKVLYGDEVLHIKDSFDQLEEEDLAEFIGKPSNTHYPFEVRTGAGDKINVRFVYYDPLLSFKIAFNEGKRVQVRDSNTSIWNDINEQHIFNESLLYRVVEEEEAIEEDKRLTKRQLSRWLAKGNGEAMFDGYSTTLVTFTYDISCGDEPVSDDVFVRKWEDNDWHEPTIEYCF